jgi:phage gp45-like
MHSINQLLNMLRGQNAASLNTMAFAKTGLIASFEALATGASNSPRYRAKVTIQPEGLLTDFLPILTPWVGNGWGFYAAPNYGDAVLVVFLEGNISSGIIIGGINNIDNAYIDPGPQTTTQPDGMAAGEAWMVHQTGTYLKFLNDGTVNITCLDTNGDPTDLNINGNVVLTGNLTLQGAGLGNISATGNILDKSGTNTDNMAGMRSVYNMHTHPTPAGESGTPSVDM